jgi:hypothetical protein
MSLSYSVSSSRFRSLFSKMGRIPPVVSFGATALVFGWLISLQWQGYQYAKDDANLRRLNDLVSSYTTNIGKQPDANLIDLYSSGLTQQRLQPTPFGGYYRYDKRTGTVYNPKRAESRPTSSSTALSGMR